MLSLEQQLMIAIEIAFKAHDNQYDKIGLPYILHPMAVSGAFNRDELPAKIVAVLHDVLEDTDTTASDLLVAGIDLGLVEAVIAITKKKDEILGNYYIRVKRNPLALAVKLRDIRHNLSVERQRWLCKDDRKRLTAKYVMALKHLETRPGFMTQDRW
jgi:(p)ppGpp synthase/HD superfamily hydrolase